jgi:hypothetical protein
MRVKHLFYALLAMVTFVACDKEVEPTPQPDPKPEPIIPLIEITDVVINDTTAAISFAATNATEVKGIAVKAGESVEVEAVLSNGIAAEGDTINIEGLEYITEYDFYVAAMFENGETALSEKFTRSTDYEPMPAGDYTEVRTAYGYTYDGFFILYKEFADGGEYVTLWINSEGIQYIIPEGEYSIDNGALMGNSTANNEALVEANLKVTHLGDQYMFELYAKTESGKIYSSRWIGRLAGSSFSNTRNPGDELPKVTDNNLTTINRAYGYYHDTYMEVYFDFEGGYVVSFKLATNEQCKVIPEGEYKLNDNLLDTSTVIAGPYRYAFEEATVIVEYSGNEYSISIDAKDEANNTYKTDWIGQMEHTGLDICILNPNS